ncbi:MAG: DUF2817 domain-containing protein [Pseudomonadota bacterium]
MTYFSDSYHHARARFIAGLERVGFEHEAHSIGLKGPAGEDLTIDVGIRRAPGATHTIMVSSGLHGVEGFFGSAVQLALLEDQDWLDAAREHTIILIHALNPYGFAWRRRWNEDNVDLNRSFLLPDQTAPDVPPEYRGVMQLLNPQSPPSKPDFFLPMAIRALWQQALEAKRNGAPLSKMFAAGFAKLKSTLPTGQYQYPKGLFFGGQTPSALQGILEEHLQLWVGDSPQVTHVDFHTGLGRRGDYALLLRPKPAKEDLALLEERFGAEYLDYNTGIDEETISYQASGVLSVWIKAQLKQTRYQALTAEFGTYPNLHVLKCLRAENRAHHWGQPEAEHAWTREDLLEAFSPEDENWRTQSVRQGITICRQAIAA